jgi:hypothetical protein
MSGGRALTHQTILEVALAEYLKYANAQLRNSYKFEVMLTLTHQQTINMSRGEILQDFNQGWTTLTAPNS